MSKVINCEGLKPGSIYRIALENFLTYEQVELYPGPSLNMIIGPNGTGKSSIVCAIVLGLCGKTSVIARAKKISEYVRTGCEHATIEIELYQQKGMRNVIINRCFNLSDASKWSINHKVVQERAVQELITSLNIQVDNLCQLLPQDRVQDFSKMDPQQLLRSTLSAVGGKESVEQLDELIKSRKEQRNLSTKVQTNEENIREQVRLNEALKSIIDAMKQRKEIEEQIDICEKKKLWMEYMELRDKVLECTKIMKDKIAIIRSHKERMDSVEVVFNAAKSGISDLEQRKLAANRESLSLKEKVKNTLDSVKEQEYILKDVESSFQEKFERERNRELELNAAKTKLEKLLLDKARLIEKVGDEQKVKMDLAEIHKPIAKTNAAIESLKKHKLELRYDLENNVSPQIRMFQNQIRNLQNVDEKRLEMLRSYSEDCYKAVMWLRDNRNIFQHPVYEPMMLEINFSDPKFAKYLESTVPARDLVAFTFESSQDMNLFLSKVRIEMGLKRVNAICSSGDRFQPQTSDIGQLSYLGFHTYLIDAVSGPDAIIRYLCKQYRINKIPIGNDHTYKNSGNVPANINFFFTENHRFNIRVSAYSKVKSSSIIEIRPERLLANTIDSDKLNNYTKQLSSLQVSEQAIKDKMQNIDDKLATLEANLNELNKSRKEITLGVDKVRGISAQINLQKKKVIDKENEPSLDVQVERERCRKKRIECVKKQCKLHRELSGMMKTLHSKILDGDLVKVKLDFSRSSIAQQESEWRELKSDLMTIKGELDASEHLLVRSKSNAKSKLVEAKKSCGGKLPQEEDFPYKQQFDELPSDLNRLQEHFCELQTRIDCMDQGDERVIREYEEREKLIANLKREVNKSSDWNKTLEDTMNRLKTNWLPPLEELLKVIDNKFGNMFAKLGCAGEIKLEKKGDEDFDTYGISILVRFRDSEELQQLTRHAQSGGERALATALYLMALQTLTSVPFRCVDEINQGMDAINERKMFQLLVKVTTQCENAQYFLLTPKLLPNLEYNSKVMIHTIMNGRNIMNYKQWNYQRFLNNAALYRN